MADTKKIIEDTGSEELRQVRLMLNNLIDVVEAMADDLTQAAWAAVTTDTSKLKKLVATLERPDAPSND